MLKKTVLDPEGQSGQVGYQAKRLAQEKNDYQERIIEDYRRTKLVRLLHPTRQTISCPYAAHHMYCQERPHADKMRRTIANCFRA